MSDTAGIVIPAPSWTPTNPAYHADRSHWSSSMLKTFRESPALAQGIYITGDFSGPETSHSMIIGSLVNVLLLEPERWDIDVWVVDVDGRNAKTFKQAVATFPERLVVTRKEAEEATFVAQAIKEPRTKMAEVGQALLMGGIGYAEYAHRWIDPTGVPCKSKVDRAIVLSSRATIVEMKTSRDPRPRQFEKQFNDMEYYLQGAFNRRGGRFAFGEDPTLIVAAIGNIQPYSVYVYEVDPEYLIDAADEIEANLEELAHRLSGELPWCTADEMLSDDRLPVLRQPYYARRKRSTQAVIQLLGD